MDQEITCANDAKIIKGGCVTSGRGMVANGGKIIVELVTCFGGSCIATKTLIPADSLERKKNLR